MNFFDIIIRLAQGIFFTVIVTLACSITGLLIGVLVAALRRLSLMTVLLNIFVYVFQSIPILVLLFIVYFGFPSIGVTIPPLLAMMLSLGLISGVYLAEVFRGAFDSIDANEILAAQAIGMSRWQILIDIEFPQMLRFAVPGIMNELTTVLKYSPFAYTVGIPEITKQAMNLTATTLRGIEIYLAAGILYFLIYRVLRVAIDLLRRHYQVPGIDQISS